MMLCGSSSSPVRRPKLVVLTSPMPCVLSNNRLHAGLLFAMCAEQRAAPHCAHLWAQPLPGALDHQGACDTEGRRAQVRPTAHGLFNSPVASAAALFSSSCHHSFGACSACPMPPRQPLQPANIRRGRSPCKPLFSTLLSTAPDMLTPVACPLALLLLLQVVQPSQRGQAYEL
jgi:hypothetical protein